MTTLATLLLSLPAVAASLLSQVELWQRKEYRLDRLLAALTGPELRWRFYPYAASALAALLGVPAAAIIILLAYHAVRIFRRGFTRPQPTLKALLLLSLSLIFTALCLAALLSRVEAPAAWAATLLFVPGATAAGVLLVNAAAALRKRSLINRAHEQRRRLSHLRVIGITGSYGKTSTKHFLSQLLPGAAATKEHRNAEFPVAQDMLEQLPQKPATYLVEMGAYRRGEIAALARLTQPRVGVITAIGNQHVATFGSRENILKAKWELIEALPAGGVAVLNADDPKLVEAARTLPPGHSVIWYSIAQPADVYADAITVLPRSLSCRLHLANASRDLAIPLAGEAALASVVAAAAAAHALGVAPEEIFDRLPHLSSYPQTMQVLTNNAGAPVIDDSYSANEAGVIAALKHLSVFSEQDKRVIMVPLIELGAEAKAVHERIGKKLAETGAMVYVSGRAYERELAAHVPAAKIHFYNLPQELIQAATQGLSSQSVVLLEGRLPEIVRQAFV
jgi:UDP-N-acetylmuramoyl-tripeptide--D-alanyl-D-alanine ligase